jgi:cytochrome c oxidase assembly protein subunit 15
MFGMDKTADQLLSDESIREERPFNAVNTWIEYINRLVGALIGLFILLTVLFAIPYLKKDRKIFFTALSALVLVIFQGWIGSIVVSTNLVPWMVTVHMLIAIIIVAFLVYLVHRSRRSWSEPYQVRSGMRQPLVFYVGVAIVLTLIQIILGTQVREEVDLAAATLGQDLRSSWISQLGLVFAVHRSFSWLLFFLNGYLFYVLFKQKIRLKLMTVISLFIVMSSITGMVMNYAGIPAAAQPVHLLLGTAIIGLQFFLFLQLRDSTPVPENTIRL